MSFVDYPLAIGSAQRRAQLVEKKPNSFLVYLALGRSGIRYNNNGKLIVSNINNSSKENRISFLIFAPKRLGVTIAIKFFL